MLDEVHLLADGSLSDDVICWLEDLEAELGQHGGHKVGLCVGEQRHGGHQLTAVEVHDFLTVEETDGKKFRGGEKYINHISHTQHLQQHEGITGEFLIILSTVCCPAHFIIFFPSFLSFLYYVYSLVFVLHITALIMERT